MANHGQPGASLPVQPKPLFGGNVGKRVRADGFKAGSPEALAADRLKEAARKRAERAAKSAVTTPPPLPASGAVLPATVQGAADPAGVVAGGEIIDPVVVWTPADFRDCAPELVELAEAWRIDAHTKRAAEGKLPRRVVDEIAKDAAFPPGSKRSLSTSSPVTLAKMFNAMRVPVTLKSVITVAPALVYIIVRDLKTGANINRLIADEEEQRKKADRPGEKP